MLHEATALTRLVFDARGEFAARAHAGTAGGGHLSGAPGDPALSQHKSDGAARRPSELGPAPRRGLLGRVVGQARNRPNWRGSGYRSTATPALVAIPTT